MISKADCLLLLTDISKTNKEAEKYKTLLYSKPEIDFEILKFIYIFNKFFLRLGQSSFCNFQINCFWRNLILIKKL